MRILVLLSAFTIALAGAAVATETTTYEYDAQGRLIKSSKSGGPASGTEKCASFDAAGNRTNQTVNSAGCSGSGGGSGGGGGTNNPPVTANDLLLSYCGSGSVNVIANDSDPDGDPITAISVTGGMGSYITGGNTVVVTSGTGGSLTYTIQDTGGATAQGTVSVFNDCGFD